MPQESWKYFLKGVGGGGLGGSFSPTFLGVLVLCPVEIRNAFVFSAELVMHAGKVNS
jgi:hypothetical protein